MGLILKNRGYKFKRLEREFCKAINKYIREFQKWALPSNLNAWFRQIFSEQSRTQTTSGSVQMSSTQPPIGSNIQRDAQVLISQP